MESNYSCLHHWLFCNIWKNSIWAYRFHRFLHHKFLTNAYISGADIWTSECLFEHGTKLFMFSSTIALWNRKRKLKQFHRLLHQKLSQTVYISWTFSCDSEIFPPSRLIESIFWSTVSTSGSLWKIVQSSRYIIIWTKISPSKKMTNIKGTQIYELFSLTHISKMVGREFLFKTPSLIKSFLVKWWLQTEIDFTLHPIDWCFWIAAIHRFFISMFFETLKTIDWKRILSREYKKYILFVFLTEKMYIYTFCAFCIITRLHIAISF